MGWFFVTILLPLIAPLGLMLVLQALPLPVSPSTLSLLTPVKDGQLCWGVIGFCASALYEIAVPAEAGVILDPVYVGYFNAGFITILVAASFIAAGGAVFPTKLGCPRGLNRWHHYKALVTSIALSALSAGAYMVVHCGVLKPAFN